jgi:dihydropteroate synthase
MDYWQCGRFKLPLESKTYVMGFLNVTPDSFSGDGLLDANAMDRALQMVDDGADILDIGGESTRPGATPLHTEEEKQRVLPLLEQLAGRVDIPISIDTSKAAVAVAALEAGASIVNDISAGTFDSGMFNVLAKSSCGMVLMHLRATPQEMGWSRRAKNSLLPDSSDLLDEILDFWKNRIEAAKAVGITEERICLDAGFGFGKSYEENLEILRRGRELKQFVFPILSGTSRKSTLGKALGGLPVEERIWATAATVALAIEAGADVVRVHDVKEMAEVARMTDAVVRNKAG